MRVGSIGAGLRGGSVGRAYGQLHPTAEIIGISRSQTSRDAAIERGAITSATDDVDAACRGCDLVVVCVPVDAITAMVIRAAEHCRDDAIIIDLGSTKATIVRTIDKHDRASGLFVGTHPIAGSEKTGAENARADLFKSKTLIITPGARTPDWLVERTETLWRSMESNIVRMTPEDHDHAMASVSHVPHLVASMLASQLPPNAEKIVGGGWIDTTRVASGDPTLWTAICRENAVAIAQELQNASGWLDKIAACISQGQFDDVHQMLENAKDARDAIVANRTLPVRR